jgi:hypothetical protein
MIMTAEERVSKAINQTPTQIVLGGETYNVAPSSAGTMAEVSAIVAQYPEFELSETLGGALAQAKDYDLVPDVLAALILGSRKMHKPAIEVKTEITRLLGFIPVKRKREVKIDGVTKFDQLRDVLRHDVPPSETQAALKILLVDNVETAFFFDCIIFLRGTSITRPTKMTAFGQA